MSCADPQPEGRRSPCNCTRAEVAKCGFEPGIWACYCTHDRVRLVAGSLIVMTLHTKSIWLALDSESLEQFPIAAARLERLQCWNWDKVSYPSYSRVPSNNGFYNPADASESCWPIIRMFHFAFLEQVCAKFDVLRASSQRKHQPGILSYMETLLGKQMPRPDYSTSRTDLSHHDLELDHKATEYATDLREGHTRAHMQTERARNDKARLLARAFHGATCCVCRMDFGARYGSVADGFIHMHHLKHCQKPLRVGW